MDYPNPTRALYGQGYAQTYIERTSISPYTISKNRTIAEIVAQIGCKFVFDLGGNISGILAREGSLRTQLNRHGINYIGMDLSSAFFDPTLAIGLGVNPNEIYNEMQGVVGDMMSLPLRDGSIPFFTCADVIEHLPNPELAMSEMYRALIPGGHAAIVVPSLYKLDCLDLPHITNKRVSSHESRLTIKVWKDMFERAGMLVRTTLSRPLGIASGLAYLMWLDPDYVPERKTVDGKEIYSAKALLFKTVKNEVCLVESAIDAYLLGNPDRLKDLQDLISLGEVAKILDILKELVYKFAKNNSFEKVQQCIENFDCKNIPEQSRIQFREVTKDIAEQPMFLGNSALIILEKPRQFIKRI